MLKENSKEKYNKNEANLINIGVGRWQMLGMGMLEERSISRDDNPISRVNLAASTARMLIK